MTHESSTRELLSLVEDTREHLSYLLELGVENCETAPAAHVPSTTQGGSPAAKPIEGSTLVARNAPRLAVQPTAAVARLEPAPLVPIPTTPTVPALFMDVFKQDEEQLAESTESFEQIWAEVGNCTRCPLSEGRKNVVHTEGDRKARLMFVGEAPGADEDVQSRPFVGRAGQLLTKIIEAIGMKREDVLIGNVNRCRPPGNRPPTPDEVAMCKPFLLREIAAARPEVIVVMGNTAMKNLLGTNEGITRARGQFRDFKGIKVMPTFHPAYLLRDPSKKRETWDDLKKVRDYLENSRDKKG